MSHTHFENYSKLNCKKEKKKEENTFYNVLFIYKVPTKVVKTKNNTPEKENKLEHASGLKIYTHTEACGRKTKTDS